MPRILFLTELLPFPLVAGAKTRAYYVLRQLAERHAVTLVSFVRAGDRPEYISHLQTFLDEVHTIPMQRSLARNVRASLISLLTGRPVVIVREEIGAMQARVRQLLASNAFEAVHADQVTMAQFGLLGGDRGVKRLLDQHNSTFKLVNRLADNQSFLPMRLILRREARAFARYETDICRRYDHVTFVTDEDRQALLAQMGDQAVQMARTTVIPICVDTQTFKPVPRVTNPFRVTTVGSMFWPPNIEGIVWFWEHVWPLVRAQVPQARLTLIGKDPPEHLKLLDQEPDVEVTGYVDDLTPFLAETAAFIVPLHSAGGMRVKIVDGWCWGMPIVSTRIGAEGISYRDGEHLMIADSADGFAQAVVALVRQRELGLRLGSSGRNWVEEKYDWRRVYGVWDDVYAQLC